MNHIIVGKGNVGVELFQAIKKAGESARILTRSEGFEFPTDLPHMHQLNPDYIWITAGAGSVESAKLNFKEHLRTHVMLPKIIMEEFKPEVKVCIFSSDYAADEEQPSNPELFNTKPRSLYALGKTTMEQMVKLSGRPNTSVVRIGSVYGAQFYDKTLPGKLHKRFPTPCQLDLPMNRVTPTPASWIAEMLMKHKEKLFTDKPTLHHLAPSGSVSMYNWGQKILGEDYKVHSKGFDNERPLCSNLMCTLEQNVPDWSELWQGRWWEVPKDESPLDL